MLRLYCECNNDGAVLCASKNHSECIDVPPHVLHLPVGETSLEPGKYGSKPMRPQLACAYACTSGMISIAYVSGSYMQMLHDDATSMRTLFESAVED